jgi:hypothetical protein
MSLPKPVEIITVQSIAMTESAFQFIAFSKTLCVAFPLPSVVSHRRAAEAPLTPEEITKHFLRAKAEDVAAILETLVVMGQARKAKEPGRYVG